MGHGRLVCNVLKSHPLTNTRTNYEFIDVFMNHLIDWLLLFLFIAAAGAFLPLNINDCVIAPFIDSFCLFIVAAACASFPFRLSSIKTEITHTCLGVVAFYRLQGPFSRSILLQSCNTIFVVLFFFLFFLYSGSKRLFLVNMVKYDQSSYFPFVLLL